MLEKGCKFAKPYFRLSLLIHPTYSAQIKRFLDIKLKPTKRNHIQTGDALSGNLICFSSILIRSIGYLAADRVPHCQADIVYTYQDIKSGFIPIVVGDSICNNQEGLTLMDFLA